MELISSERIRPYKGKKIGFSCSRGFLFLPCSLLGSLILTFIECKMSARGLLKRATLLRNLKTVVERIPTLDLPAKISAVYAFGGILREKSRLHDFDLVFLYSMTPDQVLRWNKFRDNFATYGMGSNYAKHPIAELEAIFAPFKKQGIPLRKAVEDKKVAAFLAQKGVPPSWAGCFSWTEISRGYHGDGLFYPDVSRIIHRMLIGRSIRGLQVQIQSYEEFIKGHSWLVAKNYVLAWSPEKPNVEENIEGRSLQDRISTIIKELDFFINEQIPQYIAGSDLWRGYLKAKEDVLKKSAERGVKIDLQALDKQHIEIKRMGSESYEELLQKCELARNEMRKYRDETIVLEEIGNALGLSLQAVSNQYLSAEDYIAKLTIEGSTRNGVKEDAIRQILRILKLPENNVITIKGYGFTTYRLSENGEDRNSLLRKAELEKVRRKYLLGIMKAIKPLEKDAHAELDLNDKGEPELLEITIWKQIEADEKAERKALRENLEARNFKTKNWSCAIEGIKYADLTGKENLKQLQDIAKRMLTTNT